MKWSLLCFSCAAMAGFGVNEAVLLGLLRSDLFSEPMALLISTFVAAICTYILCRVWVFRQMPTDKKAPAFHV